MGAVGTVKWVSALLVLGGTAVALAALAPGGAGITATASAQYVEGPELRVQAKPNARTVPPRKRRTRFKMVVRNIGDEGSGRVKLCVKAPKKRIKVEGPRCVTRQNIRAGGKQARKARLRIKPKARGRVTRIRFVARGPEVERQQAVATLRVRG